MDLSQTPPTAFDMNASNSLYNGWAGIRPTVTSALRAIRSVVPDSRYRNYVPARRAMSGEAPLTPPVVTVQIHRDANWGFEARRYRRHDYHQPATAPLFVVAERSRMRAMPDFWDRSFATAPGFA